ncbi:MAG TPA: SUMF1/EgtB/PvdO family nonheme iron enzyme [Anaerolineales bacterium]|nr:SUMF1/EgtB/PvdO family nonheme iron enzyme [Anaerolineales bacterium]HMX17912.1 SUMF1/EgtB/PvdO family nonheme iron enzyme [Anaerolineales bacterium]
MTRKLRVFLCHASQDKPAVRGLYKRLAAESWIDPWLDEEKLLPGQSFDHEIYNAARDSDIIIICLSKVSVAKEGYVNREIRRALDAADEKPEGAIFIIPLRLDDCTPSFERLKQLHYADYFTPNAHEKLIKSLRLRADALKIETADSPVAVTPVTQTAAVVTSPAAIKQTPGGHPIYTFGGMDFVKIPAADFFMGADDIEEAKPQHLVYQLNYDFYMGRFPVTNLQYSKYTRELGQPVVLNKEKADHPVVNVTWHDAQNYIAWMNRKFRNELPAEFAFRLPSEAEWERAARGTNGSEYPWGNSFDKNKCNSSESGIGDTTPVGKYSPQGDSPEGCADMAGNVWEWTRSLYDFKYPYRFDDGREDEGAGDDVTRVLRGGSCSYNEWWVRCASRDRLYPNFGNDYIGFRVVCVVASVSP